MADISKITINNNSYNIRDSYITPSLLNGMMTIRMVSSSIFSLTSKNQFTERVYAAKVSNCKVVSAVSSYCSGNAGVLVSTGYFNGADGYIDCTATRIPTIGGSYDNLKIVVYFLYQYNRFI